MQFKQMSPLDLETMLEAVETERSEQERKNQVKAESFAHVSHAFGVSYEEMTQAQKEMAETTAKAWGRRSAPRGYGFSIPTEDRKPQVK